MSLVEKTELFEQLREMAAEFAGKFEENLSSAKLSLTNFYGTGTILSFVIFPGFEISLAELFLNKDIKPLEFDYSGEELFITYCLEGKISQGYGMDGPAKIIETGENVIFIALNP